MSLWILGMCGEVRAYECRADPSGKIKLFRLIVSDADEFVKPVEFIIIDSGELRMQVDDTLSAQHDRAVFVLLHHDIDRFLEDLIAQSEEVVLELESHELHLILDRAAHIPEDRYGEHVGNSDLLDRKIVDQSAIHIFVSAQDIRHDHSGDADRRTDGIDHPSLLEHVLLSSLQTG